MNRLEEQDNQKIDFQPESVAEDIYPIQTTNTTKSLSDDIKWEYKTNDTFQEYNYYEAVTSTSKRPELAISQDKNINDEPGALFFQIPEGQDPLAKQESLNLQESKNALAGSDILYANLQNEINKQSVEPVEPPRVAFNITEKKTAPAPVVNEKDVEVFQAPLLTAFTLEQDERGLPRRIIPLEASELRSILNNKVNYEPEDSRRAREQQPIRDQPSAREQPATREEPTLREQQRFQVPQPVYRNAIGNIAPEYQDEQKRIRLELEAQYQQLQERKRQFELERERLFVEQERARRFRQALEQRQKEQAEYLRAVSQNEIIKPEIAFQKSVEPPLSFNIYDKQPVLLQPFSHPIPARQVQQNYEFPESVDRQLQNLLLRSGLNQGRQEDLNIVSKVLALNHEGEEERPRTLPEKTKEQRENEFQYGDLQSKRIIPVKQQEFYSVNNYNN